MSEFLHRLAEELRVREKFMEDHSTTPAFQQGGQESRLEFDRLLNDLKAFVEQVTKARDSGKDFDVHFEREIKERAEKMQMRIEAWSKTLQR
ncbi:hypothetical protein [Kordiimonas marina]|uniref:hypothetical protein n=1 Tax=Kordiimonas marina TaxID=2872312 RepID=UPI001FF112EB|nr:hypothetical protein [Kordiimonas marina]MCJ9428788.1 hypothetical protein [Kordiimonas marina]